MRQRRQRRARTAAVVQKSAKGARTDIVAPDEAKPIEPLLVGETGGFAVIRYRGSSFPRSVHVAITRDECL
jgi:hypothetical protein